MKEQNHLRTIATDVFRVGLEKIHPDRMVRDQVTLSGDSLTVRGEQLPLEGIERICCVAIGKAADPLTLGLEEVLGDRISAGVVLSNAFFDDLPKKYEQFECTHPLPTRQNLEAADAVLNMVQGCSENDLVICMISGGGSSIFSRPAEGISVEEKADICDRLMKAGADIHQLNAVRKHLSQVKGGRFLQAIAPARALALYLSDVPGDELGVIASGPTAPDSTTFADAEKVLKEFNVFETAPESVRRHISSGAAGDLPETLKAGDPALDRCTNVLLGCNRDLLDALEEELRNRGFWTVLEPEHFSGTAREFGRKMAHKAVAFAERLDPSERPFAYLQGGETTVVVTGDGLGGRNTEVALSAAMELDGREHVAILAAGSDGKDGPTDAAGAVADGTTVKRGRAAGVDAQKMLRNNDSCTYFKTIDDALITGPTGTNLMDIVMLLVDGKQVP